MLENPRLYAIKPLQWSLTDQHWPTLADVPMVFIAQFALPDTVPYDLGVLAGASLYLFGGPIRHDAQTYHVEYKLLELRKSGELIIHHLAQRGTTVYFESVTAQQGEPLRPKDIDFNDRERWNFWSAISKSAQKAVRVFYGDRTYEESLWTQYLKAGKPQALNKWIRSFVDRDFAWLYHRPRWITEGDWPTYRAKPMLFLTQVAQRDNQVTRQRIGGDEMLYLFAAADGLHTEFKLYRQSIGEQSAEDHYALEEMMGEYLRDYKNVSLIRDCIKRGGRYMQEFMLEQKRISTSALQILTTDGANKEIRDSAAARLASAHETTI